MHRNRGVESTCPSSKFIVALVSAIGDAETLMVLREIVWNAVGHGFWAVLVIFPSRDFLRSLITPVIFPVASWRVSKKRTGKKIEFLGNFVSFLFLDDPLVSRLRLDIYIYVIRYKF